MGVYSKALRHVDSKDFRKTHQRLFDEQKSLCKIEREQKLQERKEIEKIKKLSLPFKSDWRSELFVEEDHIKEDENIKVNVKVPEKLKSNWRNELSEGMTTGGGEIQFAPTDVPLDTIDAADPDSFTAASGGFDATSPQDGLMGAQIVSNGTGSGSNGGFNLGKNYLSFNGTGFDLSNIGGFDNTRAVLLTPVDASRATTLEITAIVGNNSNGGEAPSVGQDITLWYTDNEEYPGSIISAYDETTFDPVVVVPYNGSGSLRTYSVTIPSYLRKSGIQFVFSQYQGTNPTTTNDNYGITQIKVKRTTPISVFAPLDTPEAVSFFRTGTGPNVLTPEQRYRKVMQQLLASKSYTNKIFGSEYPGSNFSGISGISASPVGKDASYDTWKNAAEKNAELAASTFVGSQQSKGTVPRSTSKGTGTKSTGSKSNRVGPLGTVKNAARAASASSAALKIAPTAKSYVQKGMLNPLGQKPTVRSGAAGRQRVDVYRGRPYQGDLKLSPGKSAFASTKAQTAATYTKPGALKGVPGTGGIGSNVKIDPKGTLDKGSLPQRYIDKYGGRSVLGQQQIKMSPSAAAKTFGGTVNQPSKPSFTSQQQKNLKSVQTQLKGIVNNPYTKAISSLASSKNPISLGIQGGQVLSQIAKSQAQQNRTAQQAKLNQLVPSGKTPYGAAKPAQIKALPTKSQTIGTGKGGVTKPSGTTFQNTGGYGKYAPPSTQVKTPTPTSTSGYSKASGYLRPTSTPTPTPKPVAKAPTPAPKPTTTAKKK